MSLADDFGSQPKPTSLRAICAAQFTKVTSCVAAMNSPFVGAVRIAGNSRVFDSQLIVSRFGAVSSSTSDLTIRICTDEVNYSEEQKYARAGDCTQRNERRMRLNTHGKRLELDPELDTAAAGVRLLCAEHALARAPDGLAQAVDRGAVIEVAVLWIPNLALLFQVSGGRGWNAKQQAW
jgi:hypothetical protein